MNTVTLTEQDYQQIANMAKSECQEEFQIDYAKGDCTLYLQVIHTEKWHGMVGASFMGFDELIGECYSDFKANVIACMNDENEDVSHDFDCKKLDEYLN